MLKPQLTVRPAAPSDVERLTAIWFEGWHDAHDALVPPLLVRLRTRDSFRDRLSAELDTVRVIGDGGNAQGFAMIRGAELYQFYVAASARGAGVATRLIRHVEAELAASGVEVAWLACAVGNARAARFYEKSGWRRVATATVDSDTTEGPVPVRLWRHEKALAPGRRPHERTDNPDD